MRRMEKDGILTQVILGLNYFCKYNLEEIKTQLKKNIVLI